MPRIERCSAQFSGGDWCDEKSVSGAPFPICPTHLRQAYLFAAEMVAARTDMTNPSTILYALRKRDERSESNLRSMAGLVDKHHLRDEVGTTSVIYYVLIGDLVKIGTTQNLSRRMAVYPPTAELLATESGSYDLECERLQRFAEYHTARREWFTKGERLMAHIKELSATAA